jgi:hypothetical protein
VAIRFIALSGLRCSLTEETCLDLPDLGELSALNQDANVRIPTKGAELGQTTMNPIVTFDLESDMRLGQSFQKSLCVWWCVATDRDKLLVLFFVI